MNLEERAASAFATVLDSVESGRIPGAALGIVDREGNRAVRLAGLAAREPLPEPLTRAHRFDLASLTKVIFTATRVLELAAEGRIDLEAPLAGVIPDLRQYDVAGAPERRLTFRQCLTHRTFLPAVVPLYTLGLTPDTLKAHVLQHEWRQGPAVYSDINFILLGIAIERVTGRPLATQPLDAGLAFGPLDGPVAATEFCHWRNRLIRGEVHDENAFALGGAAGHAGLFGGIDDVLGFASGLLSGGRLPEPFAASIFERQAGDRSFGWQVRHDGWSGGRLCGPRAIGHTGFTGTGLWIDPDAGLAWALLTNRVHPSRHVETGIAALRQAVGERVVGRASG
jgi:CubicO group peptidase (beta-lactamase class C family)